MLVSVRLLVHANTRHRNLLASYTETGDLFFFSWTEAESKGSHQLIFVGTPLFPSPSHAFSAHTIQCRQNPHSSTHRTLFFTTGIFSFFFRSSSWRWGMGIMDSSKKSCVLFALLFLFSIHLMRAASGNAVFQVRHKYGGRSNHKAAALGSIREHDSRRHGRMLAAVDLSLGGDGSPTGAALYYTRITIGNPPVDYHVQVDTGSDILWVNCRNCDKCPTRSDLNIKLKQYELLASSTGKLVSCDEDFCDMALNGQNSDCKAGNNCEYFVAYGDGSRTDGHFVRDQFRLDRVTGNLQTSTMNGTIAFGCSSKQSGGLGSSSEAVDGLIGFGQANSSILSQLASSGKVKKIFSHCLDGNKGGGIFAIGEVVQPKVNRTALVPNEPHYNVNLKAVEVGGEFLNLPTDTFDTGSSGGTIIDSGTTLAYLPSVLYQQIIDKMMGQQTNMQTHVVEQQFRCFNYHENVDDGFPVVKFHFEGSAVLSVYPHDYLFEIRDYEYCIGWQNGATQTKDGKDMTLLGDIVLSDKLVVYDLENQTIGWTEYNCSSSIKVRDEATGNAYDVNAHNVSSAFSRSNVHFVIILFFIVALDKLIEA